MNGNEELQPRQEIVSAAYALRAAEGFTAHQLGGVAAEGHVQVSDIGLLEGPQGPQRAQGAQGAQGPAGSSSAGGANFTGICTASIPFGGQGSCSCGNGTTIMALTGQGDGNCSVKNPGKTSITGKGSGSTGSSCTFICFK